jgi:hypothetical protein
MRAVMAAVSAGGAAYATATHRPSITIERNYGRELTDSELPFVAVYEGDETEQEFLTGTRLFILTATIEGATVAPANVIDAEAENIAQQEAGSLRDLIVTALLADVTLGGALIDLRLGAESALPDHLLIGGERPYGAFSREVEIWYQTPDASRFGALPTGYFTPPVVIPIGVDLGAQQLPTGHFFANDGARINRLADRLFVGAAVMNDGRRPNVAKDWLSAEMGWPVFTAQFAVVSPVGQVAITGATRTSDLDIAGLGSSEQPAIVGIGYQDRMDGLMSAAYGFYGEGVVKAGASGTAFGQELDAISFNIITTIPTPFRTLVGKSATAQWLASGGGRTGVHDAWLALGIKANGAAFMAGITFDADSLTGRGASTGEGAAINLATRHLVQWWADDGAGGAVASHITSRVSAAAHATGLEFWDDTVAILGGGGRSIAAVSAGGSTPVNYLVLQANNAGTAARLIAGGSDTDVNLALWPKGAGMLDIIGPTTAPASTTPAGYFSAVVNGATRKIALYV